MGLEKRGLDQRKSFRCKVPEPHRDALLKVGRRRFPVHLFNESAGGFAAWSDRDLHLTVGDVVSLSTASGDFDVRVAYLMEIDEKEADITAEGSLFRIGMERLSDLQGPAEKSVRANAARTRQSRLLPSNTCIVVATTLLVLGVIAGSVAVLDNRSDWLLRVIGRPPAVANHFPNGGAERTALAEAVREIRLSNAQQKQLQDVAATTVEAIEQLDASWAGDSAEQRARKQALVLKAARSEILGALTPEQRRRWESLFR